MQQPSKAENAVLQQKLHSKTEALLILSKELARARAENDEYRDLTLRLQMSSQSRSQPPILKQRGNINSASGLSLGGGRGDENVHVSCLHSFRNHAMSKHLVGLRADNQGLLHERTKLRRLLQERDEDVRLLRSQLKKSKLLTDCQEPAAEERPNLGDVSKMGMQRHVEEKGKLVGKLENLGSKYSQLKLDLQSLLDEKEDLVQERDAYKCKLHRLNHSMSTLLKNDSHKSIDLDWLLSENRYLSETLQRVQEEKQLANDMGRRYKTALEKSKATTTAKLQEAGSKHCGQGITARDKALSDSIIKLIARTSFPCPTDLDMNNELSLRELCLALLESLDDRMTQLRHQRRASKHILNRLNEFQMRIAHCPNGALILNPSVHLLDGYMEFSIDDDEHTPTRHDKSKDALEYVDYMDDIKNTAFFSASEAHREDPRNYTSLPPLQRLKTTSNNDVNGQPNSLPGCMKVVIKNPYDIIAEGFQIIHHQHTKVNKEWKWEGGTDNMKDAYLAEDPIILPEHLQCLVDNAMINMTSK